MKRILVLAVVAVASASFASTWELDPAHSQASFTVRHMMVTNVRGEFKKVTAKVELDEKDITKSTVEAKMTADSIDTNEPKRDEHLKSAEFFDAAKCPDVTFKSTKVEKAGEGKLKVTGDLTMHCITKPVTLDVEGPGPEMKGPWGNTVRGFLATGKLNRKDYGLNWNKALEAGGMLVSEEVKLEISGELTPSKAAAADTTKKEGKAVEKKK